MAIAKFVILTICVLQSLARPEIEPNYEKRIKRASELRGEEAETDAEAARFDFVESDEDLDSSFDPYLGAVTTSFNQKPNSEVEPNEAQFGSTQNRGINLRSLISAKPGAEIQEKPSNPSTNLPETNSQADGLARIENDDQVEEAAVNTGLRSLPSKNTGEAENELPSNFVDKKSLEELLKKALAPLLATIRSIQDPQVRSLLGAIKAPINVVKNVGEGAFQIVESFVKELLTHIGRILHWILPSWIYQAIIPREIVRLVEEESEMRRMRLAARAYEVNFGRPIQQMSNGAPMELPVQYRQQLKYPRVSTRMHGKQNRVE
ncbi:uncharacterized protein LOC109534215 [Dendroctonus ponderosae]|uniref:Uncharacterized protein n=1 Tax=Dendroctonus ponderosae TaxID=77166 RepID=U4TXX3_DENPD|nr:uncharacterized protein LOC109534215 [Dendroctonus ponderosae]ERL86459.1 hypothetical protein D910_03865 [Dendroctonus ponderosae]